MQDNDEYTIIWEAPKIESPELRVYYDDNGKILFYTCEKLTGNYLVIDSLTYAACRQDLRVIDGKLSSVNSTAIISKLKPGTTGKECLSDDVSIIAENQDSNTTYWELKLHELR